MTINVLKEFMILFSWSECIIKVSLSILVGKFINDLLRPIHIVLEVRHVETIIKYRPLASSAKDGECHHMRSLKDDVGHGTNTRSNFHQISGS